MVFVRDGLCFVSPLCGNLLIEGRGSGVGLI